MPFTVALTGSTGNLGSYILDDLLKDPQVSRIVCLNRSADARERQVAAHGARGLVTEIPRERVEFIRVDLAAEALGLNDADHQRLADETSVIIHNAWPVDFNRNLTSFQPSLDGIDNLIKLALAPRHGRHIKILFVSSAGAVSNWASHATTSRDHVPEAELTEWKLARTGYGQSKLLSERLLAQATRTWDLSVAIVRVGQLAGPVEHDLRGEWPRQEWVPSMIESSILLGAVPLELGPNEAVDWIPVDTAARTLVELTLHLEAMQNRDEGAYFFHISNPHPVAWADMVPAVKKYLPGVVRGVSFIEWVDLLKGTMDAADSDGVDSADSRSNPALKLWETYRYMQDCAIRSPDSRLVPLGTRRAARCSRILASLQPVNRQWMELWMQQWRFGKDTV